MRWTMNIGLLTITVLTAACTSGGDASKDAPLDTGTVGPIEDVVCPSDIAAAVVTGLSCGYLTVPEDRSDPDSETIRVFFARVAPPGDAPKPDPMLTFGGDLGWSPNYGGIAPMAQRVNREVIFLEQRGTGHSDPTLECPEIGVAEPDLLAVSSADPAAVTILADAVAACSDRLHAAGIELAAYDLEAMAADAEDLRTALGVEEWNLITPGGSSSRIHFEIMRRYPEHVRAVILDSPSIPQVDVFEEGVIGTTAGLDAAAEACTADPDCADAYPDLDDMFAEAIEDENVVQTPDGAVVLDAPATVRRYRGMLWPTPAEPWIFPAGVHGAISKDDEVRDAVLDLAVHHISEGTALCTGYHPNCGTNDPTTYADGVFLSVLCRDMVPFADPASLTELAELPAVAEAFATSPYLGVCDAWGVTPADLSVVEPVTSDIPTLLLAGRLAGFGPVANAREAATTLSAGWVVEVPDRGFNVLGIGDECVLAIRNAWVDVPEEAPETSCLAQIEPLTFELT